MADLAASDWIPAFAGMTGAKTNKGSAGWYLYLISEADLAASDWIPAFAGMTGAKPNRDPLVGICT